MNTKNKAKENHDPDTVRSELNERLEGTQANENLLPVVVCLFVSFVAFISCFIPLHFIPLQINATKEQIKDTTQETPPTADTLNNRS